MEPTLVLEHLYLSNLSAVCNKAVLAKFCIQAIVTIDAKPLIGSVTENYIGAYKHIPLLDLDNENLLAHVEDSVKWIDEFRLKEKTVIVHCNAGQSRSAAIVCAYLMWKLNMSYDDSFQYLRKLKPDVMPNPGFVEQLRLFQFMEWRVDKTNKAYRCYQLERLSEMISTGRMLAGEMLTSFPDAASTSSDTATYKCKKCRRLLFTESHLLAHREGVGELAFSRPWQKPVSTSAVDCKLSIFIEPMKWMERLGLHEHQGKINCAKCAAKVGSWSWAGERCRCGTWITPAFHIDVKKVDKSLIPPNTRQPGAPILTR